MLSSGWLNLREIYISCYALWYCPFFFSIMSMCYFYNKKNFKKHLSQKQDLSSPTPSVILEA